MKTLLLVLVIQFVRGVPSSNVEPAAGSIGSKVMGYRLARDKRDAAESTRQKGEAKENLTSIRVDDSSGDLNDLIARKVAEALDKVKVKVETLEDQIATTKRGSPRTIMKRNAPMQTRRMFDGDGEESGDLSDRVQALEKGQKDAEMATQFAFHTLDQNIKNIEKRIEMKSCVTGRKQHTHFLHNDHVRATVEFTKAFTEPPQVLLSVDRLHTYGANLYNFGPYIPIYYDVRIFRRHITESGFTTSMIVWMPARPNVSKPNVEIKFSWMACGNLQP